MLPVSDCWRSANPGGFGSDNGKRLPLGKVCCLQDCEHRDGECIDRRKAARQAFFKIAYMADGRCMQAGRMRMQIHCSPHAAKHRYQGGSKAQVTQGKPHSTEHAAILAEYADAHNNQSVPGRVCPTQPCRSDLPRMQTSEPGPEQTPEIGFGPIAGSKARILILGSMPSRKSLADQQYYAHPRNAFWPIMGELLGFDPGLGYETRLQSLSDHGVALWDVAYRCMRPGSLDADMREVEPNDFRGFLSSHLHIRAIFFNGRKAEELFRRLVLPVLPEDFARIKHHLLPSTSPANAALNRSQKLAAWQIVRQTLEKG